MTVEEDFKKLAKKIYDEINSGKVPSVELPSRTKNNIVLDPVNGVWKYGDSNINRNASDVQSAKVILKMLYTMEFISEMRKSNKSSTLREMYYISEGWNRAKFSEQSESDKTIEDLEIITENMREGFKLRPEEDGARMIGNVTIEEKNRKGQIKKINCRDDVGDAGYNIPYNVEKDKITFKSADIDFILAVETGGMFDRLVENGFDESYKCLLLHLKGQPARSTRRIIKRINEEFNKPVFVFTDGDPWSYRIFASIAYGAIKSAHISHYLATPSAEFIGITPSDIVAFDLPADSLNDRDIAALESELTDPRFEDQFWQNEIKYQLEIKKKAEQQALAKYGLDYVTDEYLPQKFSELGF